MNAGNDAPAGAVSVGRVMREVSLGEDGFKLDGRETPLVAAMYEAFRIDPLYWRAGLEAVKGAGIDMVSPFIAWDFHELEPGRFDFTGETTPGRNLAGFLELCADLDLLVMPRPGPVIDAEWHTRGPAPDVMTLDRLHPRFLERANEYITEVCKVLAPAQVTTGGPVVLLGVDNEILYPYNTPKAQFDVDGDVYIPYDDNYYTGELRRYLKNRYGDVDSLNAALGTQFGSWDELHSPRYWSDPPGYYHESFRFINAQIHEFTRRCTEMYKNAGMEVPTFTNMKQLLAYIDWVPMTDTIASIGLSTCFPRDMPGDQAMCANWYYLLHRARFAYSWAAEFDTGWIGLDDNFGFITPEHLEYMGLSAQAAGLRGLNFFGFVERDDWCYAPVNVNGKVRPERYRRMKKVVESYKGVRQMDTHLADVGLLWSQFDHDAIYRTTDQDWTTIADHWLTVDEPKENPVWWAAYRELLEADVDFKLWIPDVSSGPMPGIVIHAGLASTTAEHAAALARIAASCDSFVLASPLPTRNLSGRPHTGVDEATTAIEESGRVVAAGAGQLAQTVRDLGARTFARSGNVGVWTYAYEDAEASLVVGVWNSTSEPYAGPAYLNPELFSKHGTWELAEPGIGTSATRDAAELVHLETTLEPHSARVFTLKPG